MSWIREADEEPIPGYRLIKPLGSGGFGEVWLCEAPGKILKAIKFVFGNIDASASGDGRARQEFGALQRVKEVRHPFVISIERIDILDGEVAIVMELAEKSLHDVLQEVRTNGMHGVPRERVLRYLSDAADGLDYLSESHNLMHLDVKPRNLFLIGDHVKVADFGLAKHLERNSSSGIMAGISPQYAAPETFTSRITKHSDQYSLAIVYAELVGGRRPFTGKTIRELAIQHMNADPDLSALPERDRRVVAKALSKDPFKRYPNCKAFVEALWPRGTSLSDFGLEPVAPTPPTITPADLVPWDYDSAPKTLQLDPESMSGSPPAVVTTKPQPTLEGTAVTVLPFAEELGESISVSAGSSQRVNFDFPEADGGVLRPTIIIGLGSFGLLGIRELRSRLTDRLGELRQVPAIRFLYLDADPEARNVGVAGSPDRALMPEQVFPTPLQPVARYRRAALDQLSEWLPREKLHAIPRSMHPQGSRALGRLAFTENYLRFVTRVRRELEIAAHPESLSRSADHAGLSPRDTRPRVFVIASAAGAASGALPDVGYAVKRLLTQLKLAPEVTAFLYLGAPVDPTTPAEEAANVYATLTELNHYADESITFRSRYGGPDGPQLESPSPPFSAVYLVQRGARGPTAAAESAERLAAYLCLDLTTPLGAELDRTRLTADGQFRAFGTGGVWFPRGLLLRSAARHVCERLILTWQAAGPQATPYVEELCRKAMADPGLQPERVVRQIEEAVVATGQRPEDQAGKLLASLEAKLAAADASSASWTREAFDAVINLVGVKGSRDPADAARLGRMAKSYSAAVNAVGGSWAKKLGGVALQLLERPGPRAGSCEAAIGILIRFCEQGEAEASRRATESVRRSEQGYAQARAAAEVCAHGGGFSLFGGKEQRNLRALLAALANYAACRAAEEAQSGAVRFYKKVKAGLEDRLRELSICRQRLTALRRALEIPETAGASICGGPSPTVELVLPDGGQEVEWSSKRFVESIKPEHYAKLDRVLQALVMEPRGGLFAACQKSGDLMQELADPIVDQAAAYLGDLLPLNDVAEFPSQHGPEGEKRLQRAFTRAAPTLPTSRDREKWFLMVPDTRGGETIAEMARRDTTGQVLRASRSNEITYCREARLRPADVRETMQYCREAYEARSPMPTPSPHARFDVTEWLPLDV